MLDIGGVMAKAFGFSEDELKMLLVAVRQMRRTFAAARKTAPEPQPAVDAYARLYDDLYDKLLDMAVPSAPPPHPAFVALLVFCRVLPFSPRPPAVVCERGLPPLPPSATP